MATEPQTQTTVNINLDELPYILKGKYFKNAVVDKTTGKTSAICVACDNSGIGKQKQINGSIRPTSNFLTHLKLCHVKLHEEYQQEMKNHSLKLKNTKQTTLPYVRTTTPSKINQMEKLIVNYIVDSLSPLSTVENPAFRKLILGLGAEPRIPDRKKLKSLILQQYNAKITEVTKSIQLAQWYCLTTDVWSSRHRSFFGATAHWLDDGLDRKSAVLTVKRFVGTHDSESLTEMILQLFAKFNISREKITCVVTDNGSNFVKAFRDNGIGFEPLDEDEEDSGEAEMTIFPTIPLLPRHQRCASHTLSLVATTDLENANIVTPRGQDNFKRVFRSTMAKCSSIWNSTSRSVKAYEEIVKLCGKSLIRPVSTRWNSTFDSIRRLLEFKDMLPEISKITDVPCLSASEVEFLEAYLAALEPLAFALDKLQGEKSFYFGYLAPVIFQTIRKLQKIVDDDKQFSSAIAKVLKEGIQRRFNSLCELSLSECGPEILAAISFPYFKLRWIPNEKREALKLAFIADAKIMSSLIQSQPTKTTKPTNNDKFFDFDESEENINPSSNSVELECLKYFEDGTTDLSSLIKYPIVRKMFLKYNTSLASSAPVERAFSYGGMILTPKRSNLSDELLDMLITLKVTY